MTYYINHTIFEHPDNMMPLPCELKQGLANSTSFKMPPWEDQIALANRATIIEQCGVGTLECPLIQWTCGIDEEDDLIRYECENILERLAKEFHCSHVYIRRPSEETMRAWDARIRDVTNTRPQWLNKADKHLTVRFGTGLNRCDILGHVYLAPNRDGILDSMKQRQFIVGYDSKVLQIWYWDKQQYLEWFSY
ncbi:hypothetical protein AAE478_009030 [Parahypoxylon ruwenzoriense]